ncbi:MAG: spondin domain-containing protein [Planctomycetota bacterium]
MKHHSIHASRASAIVGVLALSLFAACSDDDDDDGNGIDFSTSFASLIDANQATTAQQTPPTEGTAVRVTVRHLAPENGTRLAPFWMGVHDGTFDLFDLGQPASPALERLAEDGDADDLVTLFEALPGGAAQRVLPGMLESQDEDVIAPGEQVSRILRLDATNANSRYFSYAAMVLPSNDAFVANADPMAHELFDAGGNFVGGMTITVLGTDVLDAGTEINDEVPANTAFFGQTTPNTGADELGLVTDHPGFMAPTSGGILDDPDFADADFENTAGYQVLSITFEEVTPTPALGMGVASYTLNSAGTTLGFDVDVVGLSGPATSVVLAEGGPLDEGAVIWDLENDVTRNEDGVLRASGSVSVNDDQRLLLLANEVYLLITTSLNPTGELRGQLLDGGSVFFTMLDTAQEVPTPVLGEEIIVSVANRAPAMGTFQTPVWVGFHDGTFDIYEAGMPASTFFPTNNGLERLAEDGTTDAFRDDFALLGAGTRDGVIGDFGGPVPPGARVSERFRLDPDNATNRFFSYASMVIPSNDAFVANGDPLTHEVFSPAGSFVGQDFTVPGSAVLDAGTEVNDELPANTAFFGQMNPDTGVDEMGNVMAHAGFDDPGANPNGILADPMFANADFTGAGYETLDFRFLEMTDPVVAPRGQALVTLLPAGDTILFSLTVADLSGPATGFHIHEAQPGAAGPVVIDLFSTIVTNADGVMTASGTVPVTSAQAASLVAGELYFNVHTDLNPSGEVRGQILMEP